MADSRRHTFGPVVLLGLAAGVLTAVAGDRAAAKASGAAARTASSGFVTYDAHVPVATALGLVGLACRGVILVTRGRVRRAVAALAVLAGIGAVVAVVVAYSQVPDQLRDELAEDADLTAEVLAGMVPSPALSDGQRRALRALAARP